MTKHYVFFTRSSLPQPNAAHIVQIVQLANAAANLGYPAVLVSLKTKLSSIHPAELIYPFRPTKPEADLVKFYNLQEKLKVAALPVPEFVNKLGKKLNSSTIVCKYYFPIHILRHAKIVHTRDWNFVKTAVEHGIPAIYERDHYEKKQYEPEIVNNPLFQVAVTVIDTVKKDMIQNGIPEEKIITLHNGFNQAFFERQPEEAEEWRKKLLVNEYHNLVVYAGALYQFKGVDLLIDVAKAMPKTQFVLAGGNEAQVQAYQQLTRDKQVKNVTFLGYIPHNQLGSLLQAADVLVYPHCLGEAATFTSPMKLFDYIAAGAPIVATEIPSMMEFKSTNVVTGWCEPDNPRQFAQCLQQVLETHPRKTEGYLDNIDFVRQYSWENRIAKILSCVDDSMRPSPVN